MHSASRAGHGSYTCKPGVLHNRLLSETCKAEMASEPCRSLVLGSDNYLSFLETASVCHVRRESALQASLKGRAFLFSHRGTSTGTGVSAAVWIHAVIEIQQNFIIKDKYTSSVQSLSMPGPPWQDAQGQSGQGRNCQDSQLLLEGLEVLFFLSLTGSQGHWEFCFDSHVVSLPPARPSTNIESTFERCLTFQ